MSDQVTKVGRLAIIAGSGRLPVHVAEAARGAGLHPFIFPLEGEADQDWSGFDHVRLHIADLSGFAGRLKREALDAVVLSGGVRRRPALLDFRPTARSLKAMPAVVKALLSSGDDALLRIAIRLIEEEGVRVVGAHQVVPGLLATLGPIGSRTADRNALSDIARASQAALALGRLDIGQGAVAIHGRVVALEGPEGTDAMLERVAGMRADGLMTTRQGGVLVKLCKPEQDLRADLPSIGPQTVVTAKRAGLAGIALEAGRSLILEREATIAEADRLGLFVLGIESPGSGA